MLGCGPVFVVIVVVGLMAGVVLLVCAVVGEGT